MGGGQGDGATRDRPETAFSAILERLVTATPGAVGAAFADGEGEAVDYYGDGDPMDLMLAAAHMGILLNGLEEVRQRLGVGPLVELWVTAEEGQYVTRPIGQGYQVTVVLARVATIPKLGRALERAAVELRLEAGGVID